MKMDNHFQYQEGMLEQLMANPWDQYQQWMAFAQAVIRGYLIREWAEISVEELDQVEIPEMEPMMSRKPTHQCPNCWRKQKKKHLERKLERVEMERKMKKSEVNKARRKLFM
ncbi:NS4 protein [Peruvian horse sickness virus]|uniref:NS4 protein n=1 Tax=Peruvian horse sickness virus TaxID=356862 RepID=UPI000269ADAC|nr:NS4 protein [Peruvian horse sickness virus]